MGRLRWMLAAAAIAVLAGGASFVWAHEGSTTAVHACVNKAGAIRITADSISGDPNTSCDDNAGEHPLDWNLQGPRGVEGPAGPQGAPGAPGKDARLNPTELVAVSQLLRRQQARLRSLHFAYNECQARLARMTAEYKRRFSGEAKHGIDALIAKLDITLKAHACQTKLMSKVFAMLDEFLSADESEVDALR